MDDDADLLAAWRATAADAAFVVLEGVHALKHGLRFGAEIVWVISDDPDRLAMVARDVAPDVADAMLADVRRIAPPAARALASAPLRSPVLALARRPPADDPPGRGPVVFLERPTHLGNLGAVVRVAAAAGAAAVLTTGDLDPWHPAALRGSAGLHYALPVMRVTEPPLDRPRVALDPDGTPFDPKQVPADPVLLFGSERAGLAPETLASADHVLALPMRAGVSSLNLATAVAAVLYALRL